MPKIQIDSMRKLHKHLTDVLAQHDASCAAADNVQTSSERDAEKLRRTMSSGADPQASDSLSLDEALSGRRNRTLSTEEAFPEIGSNGRRRVPASVE